MRMLTRAMMLLLALAAMPVAADCGYLAIRSAPSTLNFSGRGGGYSGYDAGEHPQTAFIAVEAESTEGGCTYFLALSAGQSGNFSQRLLTQGGDSLRYEVYVNAARTSRLRAPPVASDHQVLAGYFPPRQGRQTATHMLYWTIPAQQNAPRGQSHYDDPGLVLGLYIGTPQSLHQLADQALVTFRAEVARSVDVSLVDSGAPFVIDDTHQQVDFGELSTGAQRAFDVVVRGNIGYSLRMRSQNRQQLRSPATGDTVPYGVNLNGIELNLTSDQAEVFSSDAITPLTGRALPIRFTIGPMTGREGAGRYEDVISVEVVAR